MNDGALNQRVRLIVPENFRMKSPTLDGEHFAYHGRTGAVLCGAGNGGAWVQFDGQTPYQYVGCPVAWLERI